MVPAAIPTTTNKNISVVQVEMEHPVLRDIKKITAFCQTDHEDQQSRQTSNRLNLKTSNSIKIEINTHPSRVPEEDRRVHRVQTSI